MEMLLARVLFSFFFFFFLHLVNPQLQINLHLTDWENEDENLQHDCFYVSTYIKEESDPHQIISYCMSQLSSKFKINENNIDQKITFDELSKQNIRSQQLYLWSAPIDLIEQYQLYLNQFQNSKNTTMAKQMFYNCTLPYFGHKCQYVLNDYKFHHLSLNEIIHDYYHYNRYEPTLFTCYIHLECNHGPFPLCLDWTEICDGKFDCLDSGNDEEHCWKIEIHQCNENEFKCSNGQCIPKAFFRDDTNIPDCLDQSDEIYEYGSLFSVTSIPNEPSFKYEEVKCAIPRGDDTSPTFSITSCIEERDNLLFQALFSIKPNWLSNECWTTMKCIMQMPILYDEVCSELFSDGRGNEIIQKTCPDIILVPAVPILFGNVYLAYEKKKAKKVPFQSTWPQYTCYNNQLFDISIDNTALLLFNNTICSDIESIVITKDMGWNYYVKSLFRSFGRFQSLIYPYPEICKRSTMYQCINSSKCISKSRLFDEVNDCYHRDDEIISLLNQTCSTEQNLNFFKCETTNECISYRLFKDGNCDCISSDEYCDDEDSDVLYARKTISFQTICDGWPHLQLKSIEYENETDETNCQQWPLIHIYNRCDDFWHNLDGSDEIDCDSSLLLNCPTNHHICVSPKTNQLICLPIEKANDGIIDCLGAADEPTLCRMYLADYGYPRTFYCKMDSSILCLHPTDICDNYQDCYNNEDEQACRSNDFAALTSDKGICMENYELVGSDVAQVLCKHFLNIGIRWRVNFTFDQSQKLIKENIKNESNSLHQSISQTIESYQPRCHRGLDLQVWLDKEKNVTRNVCFCPPNYYGDICQYENERVSLTLQFRVTSDSVQIPFLIIVSLIDDTNERIIHSYEQFTYLPMKTCQRKYNIYLLYSTRPKNKINNYSIHIDIYEKRTLDYRGSIIKPVLFPFLPVHRLAFRLDIPPVVDNIDECSVHQCINGKCIKYFNDSNNQTFCRCQEGWSGRYCTIEYRSICSSDSLYIGKLANNRSLCVCPLDKMGPRCLIDDTICKNNKSIRCFNQGQCIPVNEYEISTKKFICICQKGFFGDQCEIVGTKLIISFDKNLILPSSIFIHFIEVKINAPPVRTTTVKTSSLIRKDSITISWSLPFHIAFVELSNKTYYLIHMQKIYKQSAVIERKLNSSDRCLDIKELFNETIANSSPIHRIKYYHLPCQTNSSELLCFYDDIHLCLCQQVDQQRLANCFEFDHNISLNCYGQSDCKNGAQCFQENTTCPKVSICICPTCYYGPQCQFSTSVFSLSLDDILSYHIRPNVNISHQSSAVLISLILTLIITFFGIINGILSLITFKNKTTREFGCGIYLLCSSIINLFTMFIFLLKFLILLFSQMGSIQNELFLKIQCHSIDFLLRFGLTMDQWLTAFVAIERAFIAIKGINFNKKKSKSMTKWTISGLVLITIITNIHDPIYRDLFEENEDEGKRFWCIVKYSSAIRIVNLIINIFHFIVPFIINLVSAIFIIIMNARQRAVIQKKQKYKEILNEQIKQHKKLLIGPCVLIILALPRLIISFISGCMKSLNDTWLFLLGYFISLIPPLLTFILFVLPSTTYKEAFRKAISQYRNIIKRR